MSNGVHAPYNFVPFSNRILFPYGSMEELPSHDTWEPGLKNGKILISMKAETPVFVSNGDKKNPQFFRTPGGDRALPGSTVRGMVRENMQILGFGLVQKGEDLEDYQIFFRDMTSAAGSTGDERKKHYRNALDIKTKRSETGKTYTVPERVQAGYLRKDGDTYRILPTQGPYLRVSRRAEMVTEIFSAGELKKDAQVIPVFYREKGSKVTALRRADRPAPRSGDWKHGVLLFTGRPIKTNPLYLFPDPDPEAASLPLKEEDVLSYAEDWERRENVLKPDKDFWKLPEKDGEQKPVFYTRYNDHNYWGMSLFLRVGYPYSLAHGLPQPHQDEAAAPHGVDYPHAILGFADKKSAYRSRVSFGDLLAVGTAKELPPVSMILGEPKPSYYAGYAYGREKNNDNAVRHYANEDFKLRGYKLYWHKAEVEQSEVPDGKERVGTTLRPLDKGTVFRGVIRFKNLTPKELGLLLWSLRLDEGCFQSVGMGKPYGYGRMKLEIEGLTEYTPEDLYDGTLTARGTAKGRDAVDEYIRAYDQAACEKLGVKPKKDTGEVSIRNRSDIKDFFYMKRTIQQGPEFSYMKLAEYKNNRSPLPKAAKFREEDEEKARRAAEEAAKPKDAAALARQWASQINGGVKGANGSASGGGANKSKKNKRKKKK